MRILVVTDAIYPFSMGGSHRLVYEAALALEQQGHTVVCVVPDMVQSQQSAHAGGEWVDRDRFRIVRFSVDRRTAWRTARSLFLGFRKPVDALLTEGTFDVVNVQYLPALFALRSLGRPIHYTFHGPWSAEFVESLIGRVEASGSRSRILAGRLLLPALRAVTRLVERWLLTRPARYATISRYMRELLTKEFSVDPARVTVIPAGVDAERFRPAPASPLRERLADGRSTVLLSVRRLERRMGLDNLIEAAAVLRRHQPDFRLLIGGRGHHEPYLRALIDRLECGDHVRLLGFIPEVDLASHLSAADLFVLPSRALEGFGLVVLESMACGTPVLVSPDGGPREVVETFDPEFVLPSIEPEQIAARLLTLITRGTLRDPKVKQHAVEVARGYSWQRFAGSYAGWLSGNPSSVLDPA